MLLLVSKSEASSSEKSLVIFPGTPVVFVANMPPVAETEQGSLMPSRAAPLPHNHTGSQTIVRSWVSSGRDGASEFRGVTLAGGLARLQ
jgi:hypothetical protein